MLASRGPDGISRLYLDSESIVRSGSSVENIRACKNCRYLFCRMLYFILLFQSKLEYLLGCLRTLKIDFNHEGNYLLLTEMEGKRAVSGVIGVSEKP